MTPVRYRTIDVDGLDVFDREAGNPEAPKLLLHGFPTSSHMFRDLVPRLADRFHTDAPDLPGFGRTAMPARDEFESTFDNLAQIGEPFPEATAWLSTFTEILGGLAILARAFVQIMSVPLIVIILVAMFTVHLKYGFSSINTIGLTEEGPRFGPPGYEVNLLDITGLVSLILSGAGALSVDHLLSCKEALSVRPNEHEQAF